MKTGAPIGQTLRDEWHTLTDAEHRALHALLLRTQTARNTNQLEAERLTPGQRLADGVTRQLGSWRFIIVQSVALAAWIALNTIAWVRHWDPYPFILLNLALSFQAAYAAPIIMMSQNREAAKDRLRAEEDYRVNVRAELEVQAIHERLDALSGGQWETLLQLQGEQLAILARIEALTAEVQRVTRRPGDGTDGIRSAPRARGSRRTGPGRGRPRSIRANRSARPPLPCGAAGRHALSVRRTRARVTSGSASSDWYTR